MTDTMVSQNIDLSSWDTLSSLRLYNCLAFQIHMFALLYSSVFMLIFQALSAAVHGLGY